MQDYIKILSNIKKENYSPFYLLSGKETYFIDSISSILINKIVQESSKDFDFTKFYGQDTSASEIIESARRFPMLSKYNLIIVKEAQNMRTSEYDYLSKYVSLPSKHSIIIFCYKNKEFDKRKKLYKNVKIYGEFGNFKNINDNQLLNWIRDHANNIRIEISPIAIELLVSNIGNNLSRLDSELKKLKIIVSEGETINQEHIEKYVGISKDFNTFELQSAIGLGYFSKAFQITKFLSSNSKENPIMLILGGLHTYFCKLIILKTLGNDSGKVGINPYFLGEYKKASERFSVKQIYQALEYIMKADLKSKGIEGYNKKNDSILEELVLKLFSIKN
ncbi:MAG: DNA polymerase III subunit delta [Flavobacteriaceae bacterium]|tara:strand:+ start:1005 stop:2006 length:1002 start_codon:yes stop_codon:yes gene_type:complete